MKIFQAQEDAERKLHQRKSRWQSQALGLSPLCVDSRHQAFYPTWLFLKIEIQVENNRDNKEPEIRKEPCNRDAPRRVLWALRGPKSHSGALLDDRKGAQKDQKGQWAARVRCVRFGQRPCSATELQREAPRVAPAVATSAGRVSPPGSPCKMINMSKKRFCRWKTTASTQCGIETKTKKTTPTCNYISRCSACSFAL